MGTWVSEGGRESCVGWLVMNEKVCVGVGEWAVFQGEERLLLEKASYGRKE